MRETEYVYGVARVRVNELSLLSPGDFEQMTAASNFDGALDVLSQKGWDFKNKAEFMDTIEEQGRKMWQLLTESAPKTEELNGLIIKNDFQNLKAAIKSFFVKGDPQDLFAEPCVYDPQEVAEKVKVKAFDDLPLLLQAPAKEAYEAVINHESGRLADIALDKGSLSAAIHLAEKTDSLALKEIVHLNAAVANIKVAVRSVEIKKDAEFMLKAMVVCKLFSNEDLVEAAESGSIELNDFISLHLGEFAAAAQKDGMTAFEKWHDEKLLAILEQAKYTAFGLDPLAAYLIQKEIELKNVRIILLGKINRLAQDTIRKRVRLSGGSV